MGHVRDLPAKGLQRRRRQRLQGRLRGARHKKDVIRDLKAALKDADELYLATDEDREGEAISWHLLEVLKPTVPVQADGLPRDHPLGHRGRRRQLPRHRLRPRRRPGEPPHRRPPLRLPGVGGVLAQDQARACRPGGCSRRRSASSSSASASAWRSAPPATGTSTAAFPTEPAFDGPARRRSTTTRSPQGRDFDSLGALKKAAAASSCSTRPAPRGLARAARRPALHRRLGRDQAVHVASRSRRSSPRRSSRSAAAGCA